MSRLSGIWCRWRRSLLPAIAITVAVASLPSCANDGHREPVDYCAIMPDAVGLYPGNPVTQMGFPIGKVRAVTPGALDVRVDFTVTEPRRLPSDVKAILRSQSILADRSLELVGNYDSGSQLRPGACIALSQSSTPKSLSQLIGSATEFVDTINPEGSTAIGDIVRGVDQAIRNRGGDINHLVTTSSALLDGPDRAIGDISTVITNLSYLTSVIKELRGPLKGLLYDADAHMPDVKAASSAARRLVDGFGWVAPLVEDLEVNLGDNEIQFSLDAASYALRKLGEHAPRTANILNIFPWWINTAANHFNMRPVWNIRYRPPMYRIHTPDNVLMCNLMNGVLRGSCANVQGQPYAADINLLQYVLNQAVGQ